MLCKLTYKNKITLPRKVVDKFGKVEYFDVQEEKDRIILRPVEIKPRVSLSCIRENIESMGLTEKDIDDAIFQARRK
ncbi:MAG TPA: AbrB/MazE/SpoVT family DNA-binding domain-containing protein [bacterium]|nr:AbrB/MazE/SpoVT family DNA-binding domain-containing protein [bacterium]